jgi:hypothetical protein
MIDAVAFDVGETLVDETREYGTWADWLGSRGPHRSAAQPAHRHPARPPSALELIRRTPFNDRNLYLDILSHSKSIRSTVVLQSLG